MALSSIKITDLPNETLSSILSTFGTRSLLPLSLVCHHFHHLIKHMTYQRLLEAANNQDHKIILECFHPASKFSSPYLSCNYLSTHAISKLHPQLDTALKHESNINVAELYSNFLPVKPVMERRAPRSHPAGGPIPVITMSNARVDEHDTFVCQNVNLDSYELFSQLCTTVSLVKTGPKRGLFISSTKVAEGTARIKRHWLAEQAQDGTAQILWADIHDTIGLKIRVVERTDGPVAMPVMRSRNDEDPAVNYTLIIEGLVLRTTKLLLMLEQSIEDEAMRLGKAIVIGSIWDT